MQRDVPELLDQNWAGADGRTDWPGILLIQRSGRILAERRELENALRGWAKAAPREEVLGGPHQAAKVPCEHPQCPWRQPGAGQVPEAQANGPHDTGEPDGPGLLQVMVVGGGPGQKPLLGRFLDLISRVHADAGEARKVVVTDPYLFTDANESGKPGGFENFCKYLGALRLASDAKLFIPPSPKKPSANRRRWIESVEKKFPIQVTSFAPKFTFHDRFYIVEHDPCDVRGVFGPSMNGLSGTDIALFGVLEAQSALRTLSAWLDLSTPSANNKMAQRKRRRP